MNAETIVQLLEALIDAKLARLAVSGPNVAQQAAQNAARIKEIKGELVKQFASGAAPN